MSEFINVAEIAKLHHDCIVNWKENEVKLKHQHFLAIVEENHAFNYQLWNAEDRARREDMGFEFVYLAKREIDHFNQQRNNRMEAMDEWLYYRLQPKMMDCPVHSETPGMMIDRLSILALKTYHMELQVKRDDVDEAHRQNCQHKLQTLVRQKSQLLACLQQFVEEVTAGMRTFRVYHQFKMYNDPKLNPQLYLADAK